MPYLWKSWLTEAAETKTNLMSMNLHQKTGMCIEITFTTEHYIDLSFDLCTNSVFPSWHIFKRSCTNLLVINIDYVPSPDFQILLWSKLAACNNHYDIFYHFHCMFNMINFKILIFYSFTRKQPTFGLIMAPMPSIFMQYHGTHALPQFCGSGHRSPF